VEVLVSWDETEWIEVDEYRGEGGDGGDMSGMDEVGVGGGVEEVGCFSGLFGNIWPQERLDRSRLKFMM
jgi:hypothetical protein